MFTISLPVTRGVIRIDEGRIETEKTNHKEKPMRGMSVSVYRNADPYYSSCNNKCVVTGYHHEVFLLMETGNETLEDNKKREKPLPVLKLVKKEYKGKIWVTALPNEIEGDGTGRWCFGGNFIYCTDSRFAALNNGLPIPVHDSRL